MTMPFGPSPNPLAALTGMPAGPKKTRRGGRKNLGDFGKHVANALTAHKAGDHATANSHLFKAIRTAPDAEPDPTDANESKEPPESGMAASVAAAPMAAPKPMAPPPMPGVLSDAARRAKLVATLRGLHK